MRRVRKHTTNPLIVTKADFHWPELGSGRAAAWISKHTGDVHWPMRSAGAVVFAFLHVGESPKKLLLQHMLGRG